MKKNIKLFLFSILISFFTTISAQTLINGNFESGGNGVGFLINGAGYTQINPTTGSSTSGNYAITTNPQLLNSNFISGGDHTTGSGRMLVVDGNTVPNSRLWSTTSTGGALTGFTAGNVYTFSYWIKSVSNNVTNITTQANINVFFVNTSNVNPSSTNSYAPLPSQGWSRVSYTFTATANNVLIELRNNNLSVLGNDFALDDFAITPGALPLTLSQTSINPTCPTSLNGSIRGVGSGGIFPYTYSLVSSLGTTSNGTGVFNNLSAGTYTLSIQDAVGAMVAPIIVILTPPNDIVISAPATICEGNSTSLSVVGSPDPYLWTANPPDPSLTALNNTSANPIVSPTTTTTYTVTSGIPANPTNLVINGDFSMGDFGFITDYINYLPGTIPAMGVQGAYGVVTNPSSWYAPFSPCTDRTSSGGNMLVADGSTTGTARVWYSPAPITVIPGRNYTFSYFLTSVVNGGPAKLEVLINNVPIGPLATAPSTSCVWDEYSYVWNSGTNTSAIISIIDRETLANFNDFAIDDLYFRETPTCTYQKSVTITVNPNPAPTIGTITHPTCSNTGSVVLNGLPSGNWTINPGGITGNTSSVTISNLTPGTYNYTVTSAANCTSLPVRVDINPIPNIVTPTFIAIAPVCVGTIIALPLLSTNGVNGTWSPAFNPNVTTTYTFTPNPGECATTTTMQVVITQIPSVIATPNTETICSLQSTGISLSSSISGTTFSWTTTATDVSGDASGTGNVISQVLTATGTLVGNVQYTITPTNNSCSGVPINVTVLVTPKPTLTATAVSNSICSGSATAINLVGSMPNTNFSWNLIQNNVTGGTIGSGNVIAQTLNTITNSSGEAVYAITPIVNGCRGITTTVSIIVNPIPAAIINPAAGQTLCSGETTAISFSSPVINTTFNWTVNQTNLTGTTPGTGTSITQILSVVLPSVGTATYEVTPTSNGCVGAPVQVSVNVKPIPDFSSAPTQAPICSGDNTSIALTSSLTGTVFSWTVVQNGVRGALAGSGSSIVQVLETTGSNAGDAIYTITPELNRCVGTPISVTVIVNPLPRPSLTGGNICVDAMGNFLSTYTLNSGLNNTDYTFQWFLNGVLQSGSNNTYVAGIAGNYSVIATNVLTGCVSSSVFATVTSSLPATSITAVGTFAFDQNASITVTALAPNPNYQYSLDYGALQFSNVFTNVNPGSHLVTVTDTNGCTNLSTNVFIIGYPTFFTPNSDGFNDYWNVIGMENQPTANIYIFDRYGKLMKQISSKSLGWDGTYLGSPVPSSDYWFTIEYIEPLTTDVKVFKSHFSLKR